MSSKSAQNIASGLSPEFAEELYERYLKSREDLDDSWRYFFDGVNFAQNFPETRQTGSSGGNSPDAESAKVEALINAYRRLGHLNAHLNPLAKKPEIRADLHPNTHGLADVDQSRQFHTSNLGIPQKSGTFPEILKFLQETYCGNIGADYRDVNEIEAVLWLQERMESCRNHPSISLTHKQRILEKLTQAEGFERFLQDRYLGQKRFSIEGLDSMIVLLDVLADQASTLGVQEMVIGMAHRGRLNVLANFMGKPYEEILKEFEGGEFNPAAIEGDVKYHKGYASEVTTFSQGKIRLYLSPNPSHLEAVNPIVEGFARARQRLVNDSDRKIIMPLLIHGDAAFVGQGIVAETLNFAALKNYTTGGTIHIIANNQVGFTANPEETKSCDYASDIAKLIRAPVLHVNADDAEAVVWCAQLAAAYRQKFARDFVIDLVGYRRHGHNETDEPAFTQPLMYKVIKEHPTVLTIYSKTLNQEGSVSATQSQQLAKDFRAKLQECQKTVREGKYKAVDQTPEALKYSVFGRKTAIPDMMKPVDTKVSEALLRQIAERITTFPQGFHAHPKIAKLYESRKEMMQNDGNIDWGFAELLAYGSCALEGHHVRLSGQDCGRGTFSHRQAVLRDVEDNHSLEILNQIDPNKQGRVDIINSPLSEAGCMGFEFGYSVADHDALVLWEGQFGDFVNGAQIVIDQFLVASEAKWKQTSGLVLLLPHGYEGQGPEHSSARPERFLQSCGGDNIQVVNVTIPSQFFHVLRRQILRPFRKPLVVMTPKSLLRHPKVVSKTSEFSEGGFLTVMDDSQIKDASSCERLVVCTGKIYYELEAERTASKDKPTVPIVRIEQLYPFDQDHFLKVLKNYPNIKEVVWTQEEPQNMGAWTYIRPLLEAISGVTHPNRWKLSYVGRQSSGSTAEGSAKSHAVEQQRIVKTALLGTA